MRIMKSTVAKRYAAALHSLALEFQAAAAVNRQLGRLAKAWEAEPLLGQLLAHPRLSQSEKEELLQKVGDSLGLGDLTVNALRLMLDKGRIQLAPQLARSFREQHDYYNNRVQARCRSAKPMTSGELDQLRRKLADISGAAEVELTAQTDASLVAGFTVSFQGTVIDGSLKGRLERLKRGMLQPSHGN